jgi:hypothetical protein
MSGVLHPKLPVPRSDRAFDDEPTGTALPRAPALADPRAEAAGDLDNVDDDADTKIITWVRDRHPRIQH